MVIWLIGLSGAGKSTVGRLLYQQLKSRNKNLVYLDGDDLRRIWKDERDFTESKRAVNAHRISNLCKLLDSQGIHVIASVLSIFPEWQKWNREKFSNYFQVYLKVPIEIVKARDTKGLYSMKNGKDVVGIDINFPEPYKSDLILNSYGNNHPKSLVTQISNKIEL